MAGLILALAAGAMLRLLWLEDIEYKPDEDYTTYYALKAGRSEPLPAIGMPSSAGIPNFGASVWLFVFLARIFPIHSPPALAAGVAGCSILALVLYLPVIRRLLPAAEREAWYWGIALMALSPLAVLLQRKIWPPSLFPLLTLALLVVWLKRHTKSGAFLLGVFGAFLGQVHMCGFFLTAAFAGWAWFFDRQTVRWSWFVGGSVLGLIPILPWLLVLCQVPELVTANATDRWLNLCKGRFWLRWLIQPFGLDTLNHSLGADFWDFWRYPIVKGQATFLVGALHGLLGVLCLLLLTRAGHNWWRQRGQWPALFNGRAPTAFTLAAAFWGFGLLFALTGRPFRYYYLLASMPLMFVWVAWAVLDDRPRLLTRIALGLLCVAQGLISLAFLHYVHVNQRQMRGDYGVPYSLQPSHRTVGSISRHLQGGRNVSLEGSWQFLHRQMTRQP